MSGLRVLKPGPQSLLQDAGRRGWQHLGVSPAGPLDWHGAAWANHLLNNPWGTPLLEIALGDVEFALGHGEPARAAYLEAAAGIERRLDRVKRIPAQVDAWLKTQR